MKIWIKNAKECRLHDLPDGTNIDEALKGPLSELEATALREHQIVVADYATPDQSTEVLTAYGLAQTGGMPRESNVKKDGSLNPDLLYEVVK